MGGERLQNFHKINRSEKYVSNTNEREQKIDSSKKDFRKISIKNFSINQKTDTKHDGKDWRHSKVKGTKKAKDFYRRKKRPFDEYR